MTTTLDAMVAEHATRRGRVSAAQPRPEVVGTRPWLRWLPEGGVLPDEVWAQRHRGILLLLWAHVPVIVVFALVRGQTLAHGIVEAGFPANLALLATVLHHRRRLSTVATSIGLFVCSAVLVHLAAGTIEMHFHFFVMVGVVTLYQDWWPFLASIGFVVVQHGLGGVLDPGSVYNHQSGLDHPWRWAGVHGLFILGMSAAGIATWRLNEALLRSAAKRELKLSEAQEVARLGSWEWDLVSGEVAWSDELYRLMGMERDAFVPSYDAFMARVHPDDRQTLNDEVRRCVELGARYTGDFRAIRPDGTTRWIHGRGEVSAWSATGPSRMSGTCQDVTERKRAETELVEALSLLHATLDSTADGILVVDLEGRITSFNQKYVEMYRLPPDALDSGDDALVVASLLDQLNDPEAFLAKVEEVYAQPAMESYDVIEFVDGRILERYSKPQRVAGEIVGRVWSFSDVTERRRLEAELAHQAFHDQLTNLANQALFRDRVEHALARAADHTDEADRLAVLFLDLDNFKTVNDSLGHNVGDELLVAVSERIRGCLRPADTAARLGGDEFAVLLEDLTATADATMVAECLLGSLGQPFNAGGREVFVGGSVGIAFCSPGITGEQLLRNADLAMYRAKNGGKGRAAVFEPGMYTAAVERLELEAALRQALDENQLTLHYQPIVDLGSGIISGVEALVRWRHPERGVLPPLTFIPIAEETGLIHELGRKVLVEACEQVRTWQVTVPGCAELSVSVNLSPRQLENDGLIEQVRLALTRSGLAPAHLTLEITEGAMMHDTEATIARLTQLKTLGVRLAVDDFGTGYSSLSYLQRFPIDILKIDRSFVATIEQGGDSDSLARAIVSLARSLGLEAVAEGVETGGQATRLAHLGCRLAQGYHLARPQDAEAVERLIRARDEAPQVLAPTAL